MDISGARGSLCTFSQFFYRHDLGVLTRIFCRSENVNFTWMHSQALKNANTVEQALIKVENINGPILLISGLRDQWWPSAEMSARS